MSQETLGGKDIELRIIECATTGVEFWYQWCNFEVKSCENLKNNLIKVHQDSLINFLDSLINFQNSVINF